MERFKNCEVNGLKYKIEKKCEDAKKATLRGLQKTADFMRENPQIAVAVITGTVAVGKTIVKAKNRREDYLLKERYMYDRRAGHYVKLCKDISKLSAKQLLEIDMRRDAGEHLMTILMDMKLLG